MNIGWCKLGWGVCGDGAVPLTPEQEFEAATGVAVDYAVNGALTPIVGTGDMALVTSATAENDAGSSIRKDTLWGGTDYGFDASASRVEQLTTAALSPGLAEDFVVIVNYKRLPKPTAAGQLAGKVDGAGAQGFELGWNSAGGLIGRIADGVNPTVNLTLAIDETHNNGLRHTMLLAMLRSDDSAGVNGTCYIASEMGVSAGFAMPAGDVNNASEVFTIGAARTASIMSSAVAKTGCSHMLVCRGATLAGIAAQGAIGVRQLAVDIDRLLNDQAHRWYQRSQWLLPHVTGVNSSPATVVAIPSGSSVLVDNFTIVSLHDASYAGGIVTFLKGAGPITNAAEWNGTLDGSAVVTMEQRLGIALDTPGEIIFQSVFREDSTQGAGNIVSTAFALDASVPPWDGVGPNIQIGPFVSTDSGQQREFTINNADAAFHSLGRTGPN